MRLCSNDSIDLRSDRRRSRSDSSQLAGRKAKKNELSTFVGFFSFHSGSSAFVYTDDTFVVNFFLGRKTKDLFRRIFFVRGGVVIDKTFILSAAHCFQSLPSMEISSFSFVVGHHQLNEIQFLAKPKNIIVHENYSENGRFVNDIALIELDRSIDFQDNRFGFICLPTENQNETRSA